MQAEQRSAGLEPGEIRRACPVKNITLSDIRVGFNVALLCLSSISLAVHHVRHFASQSRLFPVNVSVDVCRVRSSDAFINRRIVRVYPVFLRESEPC